MWVLQRAREYDSDSGTPIPTVFDRLAVAGAEFRFGQLHLIASAPGVGKSVLALTLAVWAGVPALYFSADSDAATQYARAASIVTGDPVVMVMDALKRKETSKYDAALNRTRHVRFVFDSSPSLNDLNDHVMAYAWAFGRFPRLVVVDNVSNVFNELEGFAGLEDTMDWLHQLARKTSACVVGLHHVTGDYESGDTVVPLSGLRGKISKLPVLILTLNRAFGAVQDVLNIAVVKNRAGQAAANGTLSIPIAMNLARMWMETKVAPHLLKAA
ncbi:DnaB-like helicase C-terminal domain-containing protein [Streptosporangium sp. NPDC020072]|uniref:DnaB-like helicase C-terminal domain-containing protein n=1 Tax=Streptosporangium sp. NPDC020072 TaxID=3154788 RepID=UPI00343AD403